MQTGLHLCLILIRNWIFKIGDPPDIDVMVNHLTYCILEAINIAVPNVDQYRFILKLTEEITGNQYRRRDVGVEIRTVNS
jgi:hypothetical protein